MNRTRKFVLTTVCSTLVAIAAAVSTHTSVVFVAFGPGDKVASSPTESSSRSAKPQTPPNPSTVKHAPTVSKASSTAIPSSSVGRTGRPSADSSVQSSPSVAPFFSFDEPGELSVVQQKVTGVSGTIEGPTDLPESIWLLIYGSGGGGRHYVQGRVLPSRGHWWYRSIVSVGSSEAADSGQIFRIELYLADSAASDVFDVATRGVGLDKIPSGAVLVATRDVIRG